MKKNLSIVENKFLLVLIFALIFLFFIINYNKTLKENIFNKLLNEPYFQNIVAYSESILPIPQKEFSFRFYGPKGNLLEKADIKLNSESLFSKYEFISDTKKLFTIVVLGGEQTASSTVNTSWPDYLHEILNNSGLKSQVINCGWPDAGPLTYKQIWDGKFLNYNKNYYFPNCSKYAPDLVIVNFVETDFYRSSKSKDGGLTLKYKGKDVKVFPKKLHNLSYTIFSSEKNENVDLSNPQTLMSRPMGIFGSKSDIDSKQVIEKFQKDLTKKLVKSENLSVIYIFRELFNQMVLNNAIKIPREYYKNFDSSEITHTDEYYIQNTKEAFHELRATIDNAIYIKSFNKPIIDDKCNDKYSRFSIELKKIDKDFKYIDACLASLEKFSNTKRKFFMYPHMSEKLTLDGMYAYAEVVYEILKQNNYINDKNI